MGKSKSSLRDASTDTYQFLFAAINDCQGTIRAIDTKLGLLLVILVVPITNIGKIYNIMAALLSSDMMPWLARLAVLVFSVSWLLAFLTALKAVGSIDNPGRHIRGQAGYAKGIFYFGGQFRFRFIDSLFNRRSIQSDCKIPDNVTALHEDSDGLIKELAFEQLKLCYIRDVKILRQKWSFVFTIIWLISGFIAFLASKAI